MLVAYSDCREKRTGLGNLMKRTKPYISRWKFPCRYKGTIFILLMTESSPEFP